MKKFLVFFIFVLLACPSVEAKFRTDILTTTEEIYENKPVVYKSHKISIINPYATKTNEYQGQLQCHTTASDGSDTASALETAYQIAGYDFISITDHDQVTPDPSVADITHINGTEESTDEGHLGAIGVDSQNASTVSQTVIDSVVSQGGFPYINHPNRTGQIWTDAELALINNFFAIEVWNAKAASSGESKLDTLLSKHYRAYAIATDDCHDISVAQEFDKAWVQVFANSTTPANIMDSLKRGNFYSSTGPDLIITVNDKVITATTSDASTILFIKDSGATAQTTGSVTTANYTVVGNEKYIRIKITRDSDSKIAWSNALTIYQEGVSELSEGGLIRGDLHVTGDVSADGTIATPSWQTDLKLADIEAGPDARLEIETESDEGKQAMTIDQNDIDEPFIDFQGAVAADYTRSISTAEGDGDPSGPHGTGESNEGWDYMGMVAVEINGADRWMPYYIEGGETC